MGSTKEQDFGGAKRDRSMKRPFCIGFLGRLSKQKNAGMLLDAFADAFPVSDSDTRLAIAGSGPEEPALRKRSAELKIGDRVQWCGASNASIMSSFDLFALPSSYEGMPYVLLEALRAKLPVIATAVGGVRSVIDHGVQGFIVAPGDRAAFALALRTLASDSALRERMSQAATERVSEFTLSRMVAETLGVYRSALRENFRDPRRLTTAEVP